MGKAGMHVAHLELHCNAPALQLMQMHSSIKKRKKEKKGVISLGDSVAETSPTPPPPALPLSPWQTNEADKNPASPASFFPLMDFCVASPWHSFCACVRPSERDRERQEEDVSRKA